MKALAVVEEVDPQGTIIGVHGVVDVRERRTPLALWYLGLAAVVALMTLIILHTAQAAPVCQTLPDGLQSCTEGPDGFVMSLSGSAQGTGLVESDFSVDDAQFLLSSIHDSYPTVEDWSFSLATHGFDVPAIGVLRADNKTWQVFENGSIFERMV